MAYYALALETYQGSSVGGSDGGCGGMLGSTCVLNLKNLFKENAYHIDGRVKGFLQSPLHNLSCPDDIWGSEYRGNFAILPYENLLLGTHHSFYYSTSYPISFHRVY